jgi:outer membrane protein OmpA-like peptidoglycan-associated protein
MKTIILALVIITIMPYISMAQKDLDTEGCKDHPFFTRFTNFYISECSENYNELELRMKIGSTVTKEGNLTKIFYKFNFDSGVKEPSPLQIMKNYENAVLKNGGKLVFKSTSIDDGREATFNLTANGKEYWIKLGPFGGTQDECENYSLSVLEMEQMKQEIQANDMFDSLKKDGFIALYINFETGKANIMAESQPIIDQIVIMLNQNKNLKISIEGHTDNVGTNQFNQTLSENRAKSVMNALITQGIDKSLLSYKGWGSSKPIADNNTEEGKAKNRRVEIVKK